MSLPIGKSLRLQKMPFVGNFSLSRSPPPPISIIATVLCMLVGDNGSDAIPAATFTTLDDSDSSDSNHRNGDKSCNSYH